MRYTFCNWFYDIPVTLSSRIPAPKGEVQQILCLKQLQPTFCSVHVGTSEKKECAPFSFQKIPIFRGVITKEKTLFADLQPCVSVTGTVVTRHWSTRKSQQNRSPTRCYACHQPCGQPCSVLIAPHEFRRC